MAQNNRFRDIDLDFTPLPLSGDIPVKVDNEAIKQSLRNLVQMNRGDKPYHPEISCNVRNLLFEPGNDITALRLQQEIERVVNEYEPRVQLSQVTVFLDGSGNGYNIAIRFNIRNQAEPINLTFALERVR